MKIIDKNGEGVAIVLNAQEQLLGTLTDGDIRRGILHDIALQDSVDRVMNRKPYSLPATTSKEVAISFLKQHQITHVPLVKKDGTVVKVISLIDFITDQLKSNTVVLMVGGLGSRLGDLTSNCPKPMLKVGGRPVLELIIENLMEHGFHDFIFCVNYRADMIEAHFENGASRGITIRYVHESKRMGTAGALTLLPDNIKGPLLVMNGDIVTKVNFSKLLEFHRDHSNYATMAVRKFDFQIPYGVVKTEGSSIIGIDEKPIQSFLVSAGIYVIESSCFSQIPLNKFFDMPEFFEVMMKSQENVRAFPIHEYWLDIGREDDLLKAENEFIEMKEKKDT